MQFTHEHLEIQKTLKRFIDEEINPHVEPVAFYPEDAGRILVEVHQVVRDLAGAVIANEHVGHRFTIARGLIQAMEVSPLPSSGHTA